MHGTGNTATHETSHHRSHGGGEGRTGAHARGLTGETDECHLRQPEIDRGHPETIETLEMGPLPPRRRSLICRPGDGEDTVAALAGIVNLHSEGEA